MLKISKTRENRNNVLLMLEGKITQEWATLLDGVCRTYLQKKKAVQLDCANIDFIDATGVDILKKFPRQRVSLVSAPRFVAELLQTGERP